MVTLGRILKDYRDTGSLASALALWGFVDEHTFLTKAGAVGVVYRIAGADFECLDHPERQAIARRFEQALRQLDETCRLYEYLIKRPAAPITAASHGDPIVHEALQRRATDLKARADALYEFDLYFVVLHESAALTPNRWNTPLGGWIGRGLSAGATTGACSSDLA